MMEEVVAVPMVRQPRLVRNRSAARGGFGLLAAALAVAPWAAPGLLSSFRAHPFVQPVPLAESSADATLACTFVALPGEGPTPATSYGLLHCPTAGARASSRVALSAAAKNKPGGKPWGVQEVEKKPRKKMPSEGSKQKVHLDRVAKKAQWLSTLKGKFVPVGAKPWDKHRFKKVIIQVPLEQQQAANTKIIQQCTEELRRMTGMHPKLVKARQNIAKIGWRIGMPAGVKVHIMGGLMYDFLERLNMVILPRVRDFEGLFPNSFTKNGDFWMHFDSQEPFKELDELVDTRELVHGFHVGVLNTCMTQPDGLKLMKDFGFPFGSPRPTNNNRRQVQGKKRREKRDKKKR